MDEDEANSRKPSIWRWVSLIGLAIVMAPAVLWLIVFFVRSNVAPPRVIYRPVAAAPAPEQAAPEAKAREPTPTLPPLSAGSTTNSLAIVTAEPFAGRFSELPRAAAAIEPEPGEPIAGPIPLPPRRPKILIAAIIGQVPVPRPRPSLADDQDAPAFIPDERADYR